MKSRRARIGMVLAACLQLAACSAYHGQITNAPPRTDPNGLPGLTDYYAP